MDDFPALVFAIQTVGKTDFPARAQAIADQIARARPHAVGLPEVSQINIDLRPLGVPLVVDHTEANLAGARPGLLEQIRAAQVGEMVAAIGSSDRVVLMGDLNDTPGSPMYGVLTSTGFTDTWAAMRPGARAEGLTCCHVADLSDQVANFDQRIDYVWTRGFARDDGKIQGRIDRFGNVPADRLAGPAYPIWPSDHAGLVAALK